MEQSSRKLDVLAAALDVPRHYMRKALQPGGRCPHCSTPNPTFDQWWITHGLTDNNLGGARHVWATYFCTACGGGLLVRGKANEAGGESTGITAIYPKAKVVHEDLPPMARHFLQQAMDTLHAPDAAAVMAGSAVDAMLKELGYDKGSVYTRIERAVAEHKLTESMGKWAHAVRFGSNNPRHADLDKPHTSPEEAAQSVEFAEALGQFLFVLSKRIERGTQAAEKAASQAEAAPTHPKIT